MALIFEVGEWSKQTITDYLCVNFPETLTETVKLADKLRSEWNNVELYPTAEKLGKQFWYADKKWIPYVVILGEGEKNEWIYKVKNMKTGEEETVVIARHEAI